jgi:hypothetical protein
VQEDGPTNVLLNHRSRAPGNAGKGVAENINHIKSIVLVLQLESNRPFRTFDQLEGNPGPGATQVKDVGKTEGSCKNASTKMLEWLQRFYLDSWDGMVMVKKTLLTVKRSCAAKPKAPALALQVHDVI